MYLDHYHLKEKPFNLSPGPNFLWLGEKHREALATLNYGIQDDLGFLLLTGDVGVGKTALIHQLINNLDSSTIVAHITDPGLGIIDFFKLLAAEFNIPVEVHGKGEFLIELEKFLHAAHTDHKKVLLVVDEAQRLNNKLLDQIRVLSNIELSDRKLINIFFVGQPEFKNMLMTDKNRAVRQRIAINYHINPLTLSETGHYIEHRMKVAGATQKIFKPEAMHAIFSFTGGFPRAINILCDHALLTGYATGMKSIDSAVIEECKQELNIRAGFGFKKTAFQTSTHVIQPEPETHPLPLRRLSRSKSMPYSLLIGLFVLLAAWTSYYLLWPETHSTITPNTGNQLANASNQSMGTVLQEPERINEKTQKEPIQAVSKNDTQLEDPNKVKETQGEATPADEETSADRPSAIFTAQNNPAPDPLPYIDRVDSSVTAPAEAGVDADDDAFLAAAKLEPKADQAPQIEPAAQETRPAQKADPDTGDPSSVPAAEVGPKTDNSSDEPAVERPVTASGRAAAVMVAAIAARQSESTADPAPRKETLEQKPPPARKADNVADGQTAVTANKPAPQADPPSDATAVSSDAAAPGEAETNAAAVAVVAAATSSSPVKPSNTNNPSATKPKSKATSPSSPPKTNQSNKKAASIDQEQAKKKTQPKQVPSTKSPNPRIIAKTETRPISQPIEGVALAVKEPKKISLENRLRAFLEDYSNTYAAKDYDAFTNLFIPDARENGKPFIRLLPKYKKNFEVIEAIEYRIELEQFSYNENSGIVELDGDFFLKWLPPDKTWRENAGKISMRLQEKGSSFLVQRLDYQGGSSKNE